ncbi:MAG: HAD hydrolase-like protein [Victivallales bacterium]|nr:HAD hydrolase-like protein [Victivallales bacterium]
MNYSTILFDLDGTLTDSQQGITSTIVRVLAELGVVGFAESDLLWCVGPPLRDSFVTLLGEEGGLPDKAMRLYEKFYESGGMFRSSVYPGVKDALAELKAAGCVLVVVTGKPVFQATPILEHFGLLDFFSHVIGPTVDDRDEDKGRLLAKALACLDVPAEQCLYIGDRAGDAIGAGENGVPFLAVRYGYGSDQELLDAGAKVFADVPADWKKVIFQ